MLILTEWKHPYTLVSLIATAYCLAYFPDLLRGQDQAVHTCAVFICIGAPAGLFSSYVKLLYDFLNPPVTVQGCLEHSWDIETKDTRKYRFPYFFGVTGIIYCMFVFIEWNIRCSISASLAGYPY
jgi:hypothetical protein